MGLLKRWFTIPGSNARQGALNRQDMAARLQQQWTEVDRLRAQGFQAKADVLEAQLEPIQNALLASLGLPSGATGRGGGGRFFRFGGPGGGGGGGEGNISGLTGPLFPKTASRFAYLGGDLLAQRRREAKAAFEKMWSVPAAEWFNARDEPGLREQINPFLDIPGIQEEVYGANLGSSTQMLADQIAAAKSDYMASLGERGMAGASFAPGGLANISILGSQQGMRNKAGAITARENIGASLRGEQREGATTWSDMLRRSIIDKITAEAAQRGETLQSYLTRYGLLGADLSRLTGLGDTSGTIGNLGNIGSAYGNIAQGWGEYGQSRMAPLYSLMGAAGTYFGNRGRNTSSPPTSGPAPTPGPTMNPANAMLTSQNQGWTNPFLTGQVTPGQNRYWRYLPDSAWGY